jgi:hypothetical protein
LRDVHVWVTGIKRDEEVGLTRQSVVTHILKHFLDEAAQCAMHQIAIFN